MSRRTQTTTVVGGEIVATGSGEVIPIAGGQLQTYSDPRPSRKHRKTERSHSVFTLVDGPRMSQLELSLQESRVFWAIISALHKDDGSIARISTGEIAERAGMHSSNVSATLASLKRRRIVARERVGVWRINPWLCYAGSAEDWELDTDGAPEPEWSRS